MPDHDEGHPQGQRRVAVVVNPTKFPDTTAVREVVEDACARLGWARPMWLETTAEDTGDGQTREALAAGVDLVCALGGDGTVRTVAEVLSRTGTPLGLLPGGTGNLLARNLGLPFADLEGSLEIALDGVDRAIDVGVVQFDASGDDQDAPERVFLVMAGLGFDAAMMAGAPERLKAKVGWLAYAVSGLQNLTGPRVKARLRVDDEPSSSRRLHTVVVGNCGQLTGGLELMPDAEVDDGWLDAVVLSPSGVVGWASVALRLLSKRGHPRVERLRLRTLRVAVEHPQEGELDGDTVGEVRAMRVRVDPGALLVRVGRDGG